MDKLVVSLENVYGRESLGVVYHDILDSPWPHGLTGEPCGDVGQTSTRNEGSPPYPLTLVLSKRASGVQSAT
jgi:hypothetical protein